MNRKIYINAIGVILTSFALMGCPGPEPDTPPSNIVIDQKPRQLSIGTDQFSFGANTNLTKEVNVTSENTGWVFQNVPSTWLTVAPSSGSASATVKLTATENKSVDETRVHVMNFHSTDAGYNYSRDISVSQAAATVYINPRETSYGCEAAANSKTIGIDSNVEWDATCSETWVTLTKGSGQLTIAATENLGASRKATITLKRVGTTATVSTISVAQSEANVTGSTEALQFDVNGESKQVTITAGASWTAYTSDPSWISVTPEAGSNGSVTLTISTTANASSTTRSGFVYVKIGDNTKLSIPVKQDNMSISLEGTLPVLNGEGTGSYQLNLVSNSSWTLISKPEWLNISPDNGKAGTTVITLFAEKNPSSHFRQGDLILGIPNTTITASIPIEQSGIGSSDSNLIFAWNENKQTLRLSSDGSWSAMTSDDWITLSQYSGSGTTDITVFVTTNDGEDERNGKVSFVSNGVTKDIDVHQDGQYLKIGETFEWVSSMGGSITIAVSTTVGTQGEVEYNDTGKDWIQVIDESNNVYKLNVNKNPSCYSRWAAFKILPSQATTNQITAAGVRFYVNQSGRKLNANVKQIEFFSRGGSSNVYIVQADGDYSIQKDAKDTWYAVQQDTENNTFSIVASENTTDEKREGMLTLSLQNLPNGETCTLAIPVIQYRAGFGIIVEGFGEDKDWNK